MDPSQRRPDWRSPEFWRWAIEACEARPKALTQWFPEIGVSAWSVRKATAMRDYGIEFPELNRSNGVSWPPEPPEGWQTRQEAAGVPEGVSAPVCAPQDPLTTEQKVERDKEVMRLRERLSEAESKLKASYRESEVEDRMVEHLERLVPALPPVAAPTFMPRGRTKPENVVMLTSDYHVGEVVSAEETGGLAVYDWDIFKRRWQYHVDAVGGICFGKLTGYDFSRLNIPMVGDMVTGVIHDELRETADGTVMEWVCDGAHIFAQGIRQLAAEFPEIVVDCVIGNHGRLDKQVRFKKRYVSYDYLLYRFLALELRDLEHVTVNVHKSFYSLLEVPGATMLNIHGDNIKSWAGIPWYGVNRAVTNLSLLLNSQRKRFDIVNLGHFHNAGTLDRIDCELVLNGSAVGGNEYSIGALFTSTRPAQVLYGIHPERGKTWEFKIDLSHGDEHEARWAE